MIGDYGKHLISCPRTKPPRLALHLLRQQPRRTVSSGNRGSGADADLPRFAAADSSDHSGADRHPQHRVTTRLLQLSGRLLDGLQVQLLIASCTQYCFSSAVFSQSLSPFLYSGNIGTGSFDVFVPSGNGQQISTQSLSNNRPVETSHVEPDRPSWGATDGLAVRSSVWQTARPVRCSGIRRSSGQVGGSPAIPATTTPTTPNTGKNHRQHLQALERERARLHGHHPARRSSPQAAARFRRRQVPQERDDWRLYCLKKAPPAALPARSSDPADLERYFLAQVGCPTAWDLRRRRPRATLAPAHWSASWRINGLS